MYKLKLLVPFHPQNSVQIANAEDRSWQADLSHLGGVREIDR